MVSIGICGSDSGSGSGSSCGIFVVESVVVPVVALISFISTFLFFMSHIYFTFNFFVR